MIRRGAEILLHATSLRAMAALYERIDEATPEP
jgi:hypothetical protein